ncbi:TPA: hypothetical protein ENG04_03645 [Candidatus Poribacteria bacterium]|nr:hypothetical protein [Candidatus Poribacteria bacterium]HEX29154.1 hypothetical protein [Candidatus Poribacteria bacterium]
MVYVGLMYGFSALNLLMAIAVALRGRSYAIRLSSALAFISSGTVSLGAIISGRVGLDMVHGGMIFFASGLSILMGYIAAPDAKRQKTITPGILLISAAAFGLILWKPIYTLWERGMGWEIHYGVMGQVFLPISMSLFLYAGYNAERIYRSGEPIPVLRTAMLSSIGTICFWLLLQSFSLMYRYLNFSSLLAVTIPTLLSNAALTAYILSGRTITLSHPFIHRSYVLILTGAFLILLGFIGEIIRLIGAHLNYFIAFLSGFALLFAFIALLLIRSIKERVGRFIYRNIYGRSYDYRYEWDRFNRRMLSIQKISSFHPEALLSLMEPIGAERGAMIDLGGGHARTATAIGMEVEPTELTDQFLDWIWRYGRPIRTDRIELEDESVDYLRRKGVRICVPIIAGGNFSSLALIGPSVKGYSHEELDLLETMAEQVGLVMENLSLRESLVEAEELNNFSKLAAFILHDLKNAGSMISMILQNARKNLDNPDFRADMLRTLEEAAGRIERLISRLSSPIKPETLQMIKADIRQVIERAIKSSGVRESDRIALIEDMAGIDSLPPVEIDPAEIEKVIYNLIINAAEAIEGEGRIRIAARSAGGFIEIEVEDTGCGMSERFIREELFKPFRSTKKKGLGVGLYQCKNIVEAHGGWIEVRSEIGRGTSFKVKIPER